MKTPMDQKLKGILLMLYKQLDDLDFAVDLALLSNTNQQMQEKKQYYWGQLPYTGPHHLLRKEKGFKSQSIQRHNTVQGEALEEEKRVFYICIARKYTTI
ncbi:hypothetical protein DPMN_008698 [Dreissena polymorpha]|uniref:Uncharacterized protein n=1 Tax=Dreissena polymorpha TaxID=45954 RepID=A0A9D4N0Z0_DREPO|nr:hypothetical protein DPMN_008698 [Dreissena polymorpha]